MARHTGYLRPTQTRRTGRRAYEPCRKPIRAGKGHPRLSLGPGKTPNFVVPSFHSCAGPGRGSRISGLAVPFSVFFLPGARSVEPDFGFQPKEPRRSNPFRGGSAGFAESLGERFQLGHAIAMRSKSRDPISLVLAQFLLRLQNTNGHLVPLFFVKRVAAPHLGSLDMQP